MFPSDSDQYSLLPTGSMARLVGTCCNLLSVVKPEPLWLTPPISSGTFTCFFSPIYFGTCYGKIAYWIRATRDVLDAFTVGISASDTTGGFRLIQLSICSIYGDVAWCFQVLDEGSDLLFINFPYKQVSRHLD